jgi:hypothetical protein
MSALDAAVKAALEGDAAWRELLERASDEIRARIDQTGELDEDAIRRAISALESVASSAEERAAHDEWMKPRKWSSEPEPGKPIEALVMATWLEDALGDFQYEAARHGHAAACDCAVLIALGITSRRPTSPSLRFVSTQTGLYDAEYACETCGTAWSESKDCDDVGVHSEWHPRLAR